MTDAIRRSLGRPVDIASLAAFRVLFGLLLCGGVIRWYLVTDWIPQLYVRPTFFFKYDGFGWVEVWPAWGLYLHFGLLALLALFVALGLFYRVSLALFTAGFTYVQLMDVTNYLNHYYLVVLLCLLLLVVPAHGAWSLDARRRPALRRATVPAWMLWLLRFQVAVVYFYAGLAKLTEDWLLHAQPVAIWMTARTHTPLIGPLLDEGWVHYLFSWFGFLYDTTIVGWLLWRRSRPFAYATVLVFHGLTHVFFEIGMFPFIMVTVTTLFFDPSWPRRFVRRGWPAADARPLRTPRPLRWALVAHCAFQALFPLRHYAIPGNVLWNEQGMRWSWKVMVREKSGSITYRVRARDTGRIWEVSPARYLLPRQEMEMSGQPDLIVQLAHHIADDFRRRGRGEVEVRVDAWVSLNGRAPKRMIDPDVDLTRLGFIDTLAPAEWILPEPTEPPLATSFADHGRSAPSCASR